MDEPEVRYQYEVTYWTLEQAEALPYGLPLEEEIPCRCCGLHDVTHTKDGLCVNCRLLACWAWEMSTGYREPVDA